jgi:transposase-like protein
LSIVEPAYFTDAHTIRVRLAAGDDEVSLHAENILIAALPHVLPKVRHKRGHWHHNRAENSHHPTRDRERRMRRFKSPEQVQRFLSVRSTASSHFRPRRHRLTAARYRTVRRQRFQQWNTAAQAGALEVS